MRKIILGFFFLILIVACVLIRNKSDTMEKIISPHFVKPTETRDGKTIEGIARDVPVKDVPPTLPKRNFDSNVGSRFSNYGLSPEPKKDLEIIKCLMTSYRLSVKNNGSNIPTGNNREITRQLTGENPSEIVFIPRDDPSIKNGEIIDRWGNPLFFHVVSSKSCDIFSAGPDGVRGNFDDLVEKGPEKIDYCSDQN